MKELVQRMLAEMKSHEIGSDPLVKMLVESTSKSMALGQNTEAVFTELKSGISSINQRLNSPILENMLSQMERVEESVDSKIISLAKKVDLSKSLANIRSSADFSNPMIKTQVEVFEGAINQGYVDFSICGQFINAFDQYKDHKTVKSETDRVRNFINENKSTYAVLDTIYRMAGTGDPVYAGATNDLKDMLLNESYSADILKVKYGASVPMISSLISNLRIFESENGGSFTLGEGDVDTVINNVITPTVKIEEGFMCYLDNRFIAIRESESMTGHETKVLIDGKYKIAEIDPEFVKHKHPKFYSVCESFVTLGFMPRVDGLGLETTAVKNLSLGIIMNENKELDLHINGVKASKEVENVSEALSLQSGQVRRNVSTILEDFGSISNLEFMKTVSNDNMMSDAIVIDLEKKFFVCEKLNAAEREWKEMNEHEMYEFFASKFKYDISPIFKTAINESISNIRAIDEKKRKIQVDISKLEESIKKLDVACTNKDLAPSEISKFESIKESIESSIVTMKNEYVELDLLKKRGATV